MRTPSPLWIAAVLLAGVGRAVAAGPPTVSPEGPAWSTGPGFAFASKRNDTRRSLSGMACPASLAGPRRCVAVFDEGVEARYAVIDGTRLSPEDTRIVLLPGGRELDAEGAARDGTFVYVVGSHSAKRSDCTNNPDGRHVLRFAVDPASGTAERKRNQAPASLVSDDGRLWALMTHHPALQAFAGERKCLGSGVPPHATGRRGRHGVNIEGVAAKDGRLYFGFREPALAGRAPILRVAAGPLFSGGDLAPALFSVAVGAGRGIRDLLAVSEGLLLLIGPDDTDGNSAGWSVGFWDGASSEAGAVEPRLLADLTLPSVSGKGCEKEMKPEAMTLLEDGPGFRRVLILSDGMCDGGPLVFRIPK